jgi:hypothetical protein
MSVIQPSPLFKYRDDSPRTEEIFAERKVWLAKAEHLNDPLECKTGQIPEDWKRKNIRGMEDAQMSGFLTSAVPALEGGQSFYSLSHRATKRWFKRLKKIKTREGKYATIRSFLEDHGRDISRPAELFERLEDQLSKVGIFSLSECPDDELMWAHYASSHKGLALGFQRESGSKLSSDEHTIQVVYDNAKPTFSGGFVNQVSMLAMPGGGMKSDQKIGFGDPTFRAAFSTKPVAWSYEKEWRYVEENEGLFPWPGPLESVVFGLKMPEIRRKHYAALVSRVMATDVRLFEIRLASDNASFRMLPWSAARR